MLTQADKEEIEKIVKKHKGKDEGYGGCLFVILVLFLMGFFKGCGY